MILLKCMHHAINFKQGAEETRALISQTLESAMEEEVNSSGQQPYCMT